MSEIDDFIQGRFRVNCGEIRLSRAGRFPLDVAGPGHLGQDENGTITFDVHVSAEGMQALLDEINRPRQPGSLIPEDEYLQLTGTAYNNPIWSAVIPGSALRPGMQRNGMAYGTIHQLSKRFPRPEPGVTTSARLVMRENIDFPATEFSEITVVREGRNHSRLRTRDYSTFQSEEDNFVLMREPHGTELLCRFQQQGVDQFRHVRMQEALHFALGQFMNPCVIEIASGEWLETHLRSVSLRKHRDSRQEPPLSFRSDPTRREVFDIAVAYYQAIRDHSIEDWHPLSSHFYFLIEAGNAAIELQALGISVATEGIAGTCFPDLATVTSEFRNELTEVQGRLATLGLSEELERRLRGSLGAMARARNSDSIRAFVRENGLDQRLFDSWQRLRNTAAHGSRIGSGRIIETLGQLHDVLFLAYAMVLSFIGYQGMRTDYSSPGAPNTAAPYRRVDPTS